MKIILTRVRLAFPQIWEPAAFANDPNSQPAYSCSLLLPADDPQVDAINEAIDKAAFEQWAAKAKAILAQLRGADKVCIHDGDLKQDYDGFAGHFFLSARNQSKPLIIDRDRKPLSKSDGKPYGGCYVNASLEIYAQDNKYGKRVNASLRGLQFVEDGDAFAGGAPAKPEEFDDLGVDNAALADLA